MAEVFASIVVILLYLALCYAIGRAIVAQISRVPDGLAIAGAPVIGAAALCFQLWVYGLMHLPWNAVTLLLPWAILAVTFRHHLLGPPRADLRSVITAVERARHLDVFSLILCGIGGLVAMTYVINLVTRPTNGFDAISFWLFKARVFYAVGAVDASSVSSIAVYSPIADASGFHMSVALIRHFDYPPLFSLTVSSLYSLIGGFDDTLGKAVYVVFFAAAACACFVVVRSLLGDRLAVLFTFLMVAAPRFYDALSGTLYMGYADYPLAVCMLLSGAHLLRGAIQQRRQSTVFALVFAAMAALMKNEGMVFFAAVCLILIVSTVHARLKGHAAPRSPRARVDRWAMSQWLAVGLSFAPLIAWQLYIRAHSFRSDLVPTRGLLQLLHDAPARAATIVAYAASLSLSFRTDHGWLAVAFLASLLLFWINRFRFGSRLLAIVLLQLAGYFTVYLVTPLPLVWHLQTSADRLTLQMAPMFILLLAVALQPFFGEVAAQDDSYHLTPNLQVGVVGGSPLLRWPA